MAKKICAGGFIIKKDKFLFGKRAEDKSWAPGVWDLVGGKALKNENPLYTLKREVFEETKVVVMDAQLITTLDVFDKSENEYFTYYVYNVTHWKKKPVNNSAEHTKLKWLSAAKLKKVSLALPEYLAMIDVLMTEKKTRP